MVSLPMAVTNKINKWKTSEKQTISPPCSVGSFSLHRRPLRTWLFQTPSYWHKPTRMGSWEIPFSCNLVKENCTQQGHILQNKALAVKSCFVECANWKKLMNKTGVVCTILKKCVSVIVHSANLFATYKSSTLPAQITWAVSIRLLAHFSSVRAKAPQNSCNFTKKKMKSVKIHK